MSPALVPVRDGNIRFLLSRIHVGTPIREILKDIRERLKAQAHHLGPATYRQRRRHAYACAITYHKENRAAYNDVMNGTLSNPEPKPRYYFNPKTYETTIHP